MSAYIFTYNTNQCLCHYKKHNYDSVLEEMSAKIYAKDTRREIRRRRNEIELPPLTSDFPYV